MGPALYDKCPTGAIPKPGKEAIVSENLHKLSPILYDTLVALDLMPYRELTTPEALKVALQGEERLLIDATERAYHRSQDEATQREHSSGKNTAYVAKHGEVPA